ncbi:MAG: HDOD domain-containing protein [Gammaproteobacteria bacterium]|nr:HDOD domain-containing protein [Gammaproteobacteria bacterium]
MDKSSELQLLLARQPIFDLNTEVVAYELLFREFDPDQADVLDGDRATSAVLINALTNLDLQQLVGSGQAYVNFTANLLDVDIPLEPARCVIEVLEDVVVTPALIERLTVLKARGHQIALDDFLYYEEAEPLLPLADIIKLDMLALNEQQLTDMLARFRDLDVKLLAEKVETQEMLDHCKSLGFSLFQGNFLSKPEPISGKKISANKLVVLELLNKLQDPNSNLRDLEALVEQDPALGFKTIKLVNSAFYRPRHEIDSLAHAMTYLGIDAMRSLASLLAISGMSDKPDALRDHALEKAKFCERLGERVNLAEAPVYYSVGLLSTMDAFFDQPLPMLLENLMMREDIKQALLEKSGRLGLVLKTVEAIQSGSLDHIEWAALEPLGLSPKSVNEIYLSVIEWQSHLGDDLGLL